MVTQKVVKIELKVGFEPTTCGLRNRCSTAELLQHVKKTVNTLRNNQLHYLPRAPNSHFSAEFSAELRFSRTRDPRPKTCPSFARQCTSIDLQCEGGGEDLEPGKMIDDFKSRLMVRKKGKVIKRSSAWLRCLICCIFTHEPS